MPKVRARDYRMPADDMEELLTELDELTSEDLVSAGDNQDPDGVESDNSERNEYIDLNEPWKINFPSSLEDTIELRRSIEDFHRMFAHSWSLKRLQGIRRTILELKQWEKELKHREKELLTTNALAGA